MNKRLLLSLFFLTLMASLMSFTGASALYAQAPEPRPNEELIAEITAASEPLSIMTGISSDRRWEYEVMRYECTPVDPGGGMTVTLMSYEILTIRDRDNDASEPQVIANQLSDCQGLGAAGLGILHTSENSRYLYYTDAREGFPDGGGGGTWLRPVFRLDTQDMSITPLGGGAFSTRRTMVITQDPPSPDGSVAPRSHLYDTNQAEPLASYDFTGEILWLPDMSGVMIIEGDYQSQDYAIVHLINLKTLERSTLLESGVKPEAAQ